MGETPSHPDERWSFSAAQIPEDLFAELREANLARWPTGGEFDLDEAAAYQRDSHPRIKSRISSTRPVASNVASRMVIDESE